MKCNFFLFVSQGPFTYGFYQLEMDLEEKFLAKGMYGSELLLEFVFSKVRITTSPLLYVVGVKLTLASLVL
jgi:hypothetical protein